MRRILMKRALETAATASAAADPKRARAELLRDARFGIATYRTGGAVGVGGIVKERYVDFLVNEVDLAGRVCRLTTLVADAPASAPAADPAAARAALDVLVGAAVAQRIVEMDAADDAAGAPQLDVTLTDDAGDARARFHAAIRALCPRLASETSHGVVSVMHASLSKRRQRVSREPQIDRARPFAHFLLLKENRDTLEAVQLLAKLLRVSKKQFAYAGTKDRRAVTVQQVSLKGVPPQRLEALNPRLRGMQVGNFSCVSVAQNTQLVHGRARCRADQLYLGQLRGNRFTITLRNVTAADDEVARAVGELQTHGYVNYFGQQRFGTTTVSTYEIGCALLRSDWKEAVHLLLKPREGDVYTEAARAAYAAGDLKKALELMPEKSYIERTVLQALVQRGSSEYSTALGQLPRSMRLMYVHSFQSLVWNRMATLRLERLGPAPVAGDLVFAGSDGSWMAEADAAVTDEAAAAGTVADDEAPTASSASSGAEPTAPPTDEPRPLPAVVLLTDETAPRYTIEDVVLPLPGFAVEYPGKGLRQEYEAAMAELGVQPEHLRHRVREYSLVGGYRRLVGRPSDLQWSILRYDDPTQPLAQTDLDVLLGRTLPAPLPEGRYKALQIAFTLPPSAYATMVLREIMKSESSAAHQSTLSH